MIQQKPTEFCGHREFIMYFIWFLLLFTSFEGFGLRTQSWGGLGYSGLGWYGSLQLVVLGISLIAPFLFKSRFFFDPKSKMGLPAKLIIYLLMLVFVKTLIISLFNYEISLLEIFTNFIKMKYVLMYFVFVYLLSRKNGINIALNSIIISALFSSIIVMYILISGDEGSAIKILRSSYVSREFRIMLPTAMLLAAGFFFMLTKFRFERNILNLIGIVLCSIPIFLQMHRSVLISFPLVILFALFKLYAFRFNFKNTMFLLIFIVVVFSGAIVALNKIGYTERLLMKNIHYTGEEIGSLSGNFGVRIFLPVNSFIYVVKNFLILGVGLNWEGVTDFEKYLDTKFVVGPTFDSGFNNIIIVYGIPGIIVYSLLFIRLFRTFNDTIKHSNKSEITILAYFLMFTFMYLLIMSIGTDNFLLGNSTFIFTFVIALTYVIEKKIMQEDDNDYIKA